MFSQESEIAFMSEWREKLQDLQMNLSVPIQMPYVHLGVWSSYLQGKETGT